jgi:hypothetical protein
MQDKHSIARVDEDSPVIRRQILVGLLRVLFVQRLISSQSW